MQLPSAPEIFRIDALAVGNGLRRGVHRIPADRCFLNGPVLVDDGGFGFLGLWHGHTIA